ncbi:MAG: hypothetical protein HRU33_22005 [Rhodobacteraceae bacterium]|nr:hypothetical protein [Paracoccaceae bacterium]
MKFYKAVETPEWCFLSEAVHFLAFGKVPEIVWYDTPVPNEVGEPIGIDSRFHWKEMPDNFENMMIEFRFFELEDFAAAGIEVPRNYAEAATSILWGVIDDAYLTVKLHDEYFAGIEWDPKEREEKLLEYKEAKVRIRDSGPLEVLLEETNSLFDVHLEKVWARLFSGIHSGELPIEGLDMERWENLSEEGQYQEAGEFTTVPAGAFRITHKFRQDEVSFKGKRYVSTRVRVSDLLALAGSNFQSGTNVNAREFGHALILETDVLAVSNPSLTRPRRGAPYAVDWSNMEARLREMNERGALPTKKDACIQELIDYAGKRLGRRVGRTTVQTRLRAVLTELYARN